MHFETYSILASIWKAEKAAVRVGFGAFDGWAF
jgi:hypothetical protein